MEREDGIWQSIFGGKREVLDETDKEVDPLTRDEVEEPYQQRNFWDEPKGEEEYDDEDDEEEENNEDDAQDNVPQIDYRAIELERIERSMDGNSEYELRDMAKHDSDPLVREVAIDKLNSNDLYSKYTLGTIARFDRESNIKIAAISKLDSNDPDSKYTLENIAERDKDHLVREAAIDRLVINCTNYLTKKEIVRIAAISRPDYKSYTSSKEDIASVLATHSTIRKDALKSYASIMKDARRKLGK